MAGRWRAYPTRVQGLAIAGAAALAIAGGYLGERGRWLVYVCKPLATLLIIALALRADPDATPRRLRLGVLVALVFSLAGDVLLMLPSDQFVAGLASFLVAHVAYLVAFTGEVRLAARPLAFVIWAAVGAVILTVLWPGIPAALRPPVVVYVCVLLAMAAQAAVRAAVLGTPGARMAAVGGAIFATSDALLAIDRFRFPFAAASALVLATYFLAQSLIARSLSVGDRRG